MTAVWEHNARQNCCALRIIQKDKCTEFSWQQLAVCVGNLAQSLQNQGVTEKCGIALIGKNSPEMLLLYLATLRLGARVLGLNPAFPTDKIQNCLQENHIDFFYSQTIAQGAWNTLPQQCRPLNISCDHQNFSQNSDLDTSWQNLNFPETAMTMTLTSGSSGKPKAIVHSVAQHVANAVGVCQLMDFTAADSYLLSLPLFHVSGQGIVWRWLSRGACLVFAEDNFYHALTTVTHASLVPTQAQRFLDFLHENSSLPISTKHILLGGSHIPQLITESLQNQGVTPYCGYGMTEMASTIFAKVADGTAGVGQPLLGREWRIVNDEIWLKGAGLALGYWQNGDIISLCNQQGFLQTKDKGQWQNGELAILGRVDNQFISGGENIQPEEIENLLLQNKQVKNVFIVPKKDPEFGERPIALIEFNASDDFSQQVKYLQIWLVPKLEKFKQPIAYFPLNELLENIPKSGIKISRHLLKTLAEKFI